MALIQVASRLKLPRSEAGLGGAPQIVPWSLAFDPLLMSFICLAILVVCPCFHRLTCILKVEHVLTLSLHDVLLACRQVCLCHFDHIDVALGDVVHAVEHFAVNGRVS